jgi:hypothetical protein
MCCGVRQRGGCVEEKGEEKEGDENETMRNEMEGKISKVSVPHTIRMEKHGTCHGVLT